MYQPETYDLTLLFMILSMLCWGSWANSMKLCPGYRFQLLYWDYVIGLIAGAVMWGVTLGSVGTAGRSFFADIAHSGIHPILLAMAGGAIFNIANLVLIGSLVLSIVSLVQILSDTGLAFDSGIEIMTRAGIELAQASADDVTHGSW